MVALGHLFQAREVRVHLLLREKRGAVNALQLRILLIAQPVSAGQAEHLECLHPARRGHMRPAAEIDEVAVAIKRDHLAGLGEALDEVRLHEVVALSKGPQSLLARLILANELLVARHHFGHLRLDRFEVIGRERSRAIEVVKESRVRRRAVTQLGLRKKLQHRSRHHMRRRMPHHLERLGIVLPQQLQLNVFLDRRMQIDQPLGGGIGGAIHLGFSRSVGGSFSFAVLAVTERSAA